ncbi:PREDICTED: RNA polymerase II C-terminal domain phosphatase-like 4 [Erythranthe guttata]|uniref:RNA polymerase II C-terminal domain phosphatase-like 4 n=1 Tax=Erythranthe guttata TaxID=4155 RepID=UPI00064D7E93|nr:PREDICTED: RNA polymerase II C-terminal domain phosphatase-like 4 [Erythranthe guttata]|eukprot:XP_012837729.1 PREDICTED: RNA polymerase II C-terminal domain phosphatase-like 4 [Erythranthe guttata]
MDRLRDENSKRLLRNRNLSLVLDLDHTLLNSADLSDITSEETYLNCERDVLPEYLKSSLFRVDTMKMLTKLRPYVNTFLKEASKLFELHIYTMGDRSYALEMAKLLDPENIYFNSRIISRDDSTRMFEKSLDVVLGKENATVILDDSESVFFFTNLFNFQFQVWCKEHKENLIVIERYHFFAYSCKQFGDDHKSHSQLKSDENESEGALANSLKILQQIHTMFFDMGHKDSLEDRDLRKVLKSVRKEVLKGCKVVFCDEISSYSLEFRKTAEELGAELCDETEACVTHVVSIDLRDDKSIWAMKEKKFLVTPNWIRVSNHMCRKQLEENFSVPPPDK